MAKKILLRNLEKPREKDLDRDIAWICESFGFYENIDREKTASIIFRKLLESKTNGEGLSSTCLGSECNVTRAAALNHLKKMIASGLVTKDGKNYSLRRSSLYETVTEIHRDVDRTFEDIEHISIEIDERIGAKNRR